MRVKYQVEVNSASKFYGETVAIQDINLQILEGEFFSILGPSGSGKTTILRAIAGLIDLNRGEIIIGDRPMRGVPTYKRDISIVFQNYALFPHMNVFNNVAFGLRMHNLERPEVHRRVSNVLRLVKLAGMEKRRPNQLSGGQQQRVALSRAIVTTPKVMLLDEPLGALDRNLRETMQVELKSLQREVGITTLLVTHDQEEALTLSDRIAIINFGRIEQIGTPAQVYESPANRFVASFMGQTNFMTGIVKRCTEREVVVEGAEGFKFLARRGKEEVMQGAEVFLAIRPEKIQLSPEFDPESENVMEGPIEHIVYKGAQTIFHIRVGNHIVVANEKNSFSETFFSSGKRVFLRWPPENILIFRE
jgi:spermidine/putrescine ABC transporter ATP-binding subunit